MKFGDKVGENVTLPGKLNMKETEVGRSRYRDCKAGELELKLWRIEGDDDFIQCMNLIKNDYLVS